jgi:uncharacterized membrane protein YkvA (DUF1232 family)
MLLRVICMAGGILTGVDATWVLVALAAVLALYAAFVAVLAALGRREDARAVARFIPDCLVLVRRLLADPAVPRTSKLLLGGLAAYLASPIDLVPDFVPVAGQLDDAVVVALVLRAVLRRTGPEKLREHWPGPDRSLAVLLRLARVTPG